MKFAIWASFWTHAIDRLLDSICGLACLFQPKMGCTTVSLPRHQVFCHTGPYTDNLNNRLLQCTLHEAAPETDGETSTGPEYGG